MELKKPVSEAAIEMIRVFKENLRFLYYDEADGYTILCVIGSCITEELKLQYQDAEFCYKNQYTVADNNNKSGRNPSVDAVIILTKFPGGEWSPFIIIEYKKRINPRLHHVKPEDILELFVQVYYAMQFFLSFL